MERHTYPVIGEYIWRVFVRAGQVVWRTLVAYPVPSFIGTVLYYGAVYAVTWRATRAPGQEARWADAVFNFGVAAEAFAWAGAGAFLISVFLVAPYQLWKEERQARERGEVMLAAISEERPLLFGGFHLMWSWLNFEDDEGPAITGVTLVHQNRGARILCYNVHNAWLEVAGERINFQYERKDTLIAGFTGGSYYFAVDPGLRVKDFPCLVHLNVDYRYDTRPPTGERLHGATVKNIVHGYKPEDRVDGMFFDEQREQ